LVTESTGEGLDKLLPSCPELGDNSPIHFKKRILEDIVNFSK